ncbi:uncharacterized protein (TIGR03084 family) [Herbihabitans rhizosphaerae]|uniref:Uncharacterized protein (TIGR03084 family) n=1 Tax=Herbihabitans rhizosphaerae TaxID=1872711 RepID=A0A4Q7L4G2_9PSEU|nr:TIGR03084 family metal-binding protein [Herbihabitans rhizosphaerae]RZS43670.1 uncharacterized protein (TIGR03084 family) [Herbihabitans rhizosphaerae]
MVALSALLQDLHDESAELDALVEPLSATQWAAPTPAEGWTIAHQVAHLAWTDDRAILAATDEVGFQQEIQEFAASGAFDKVVDNAADDGAKATPDRLLERWRTGRRQLAEALAALPEAATVPWYGPPMRPASMVTARIMETWAHSLDVADALGVTKLPTNRIKHVAHIGVRTRDFAFNVHGLTPPAEPFRVELTAPDGEVWTWGPDDAAERVTGPAIDFCHVVTQRRNRADTALETVGTQANQWLDIAQAFAGPPGPGREAGQHA